LIESGHRRSIKDSTLGSDASKVGESKA